LSIGCDYRTLRKKIALPQNGEKPVKAAEQAFFFFLQTDKAYRHRTQSNVQQACIALD
jgi:hypothetical protein